MRLMVCALSEIWAWIMVRITFEQHKVLRAYVFASECAKKLFATQIEQKIWNWYEFFFHHMCTQSQFGWKFSMYCSTLYIAGVGGDAATNKVCIALILHTKCLLFDKWLCRLREIAWKSIETLEDYTLKCVQFGLLIGWSLTYTHTPHTCHCDKPLLTQFSFIAIVIDEMKLSTIFAELSPLSMWFINQSIALFKSKWRMFIKWNSLLWKFEQNFRCFVELPG